METAECLTKDKNSATVLPQRTARNASFELLRIISMLFIISSHFLGHGHWINQTGANAVFAQLTQTLFTPSVDVFVMIGAYFMSASACEKINWKKIAKLYLEVYFYSLILYVIFIACGILPYNTRQLMDTLFPVILNKYWFFSAYIFLMLASPFINIVIRRLEKKQYALLCLVLFIIGALSDIGGTFSAIPLNSGYNTIWFIFLYFIAGFLKKYDVKLSKPQWWIYLICCGGLVALYYFIGGHYTSFGTVLIAIFLILTAKRYPIKNATVSRIICFVSSLTFGVYLIHDSNEMRGIMYEQIFHSSQFIQSDYSFLIFIGFILTTFVVCAAIEFLRQILFKFIGYAVKRIKQGKNSASNQASSQSKN